MSTQGAPSANHHVLGIHEYADTAIGTEALDAAAKVAPVVVLRVAVINPGKLVVVLSGDVASVELGLKAARTCAGEGLLDELFLPLAEPAIIPALGREPYSGEWDAIGILETATVTAGIAGADIALKRADVNLTEIRFDDAMGGRSSVRLTGPVGEVEVAVEAAVEYARERGALVRSVIIANPHEDLRAVLAGRRDGS